MCFPQAHLPHAQSLSPSLCLSSLLLERLPPHQAPDHPEEMQAKGVHRQVQGYILLPACALDEVAASIVDLQTKSDRLLAVEMC